tara:strand:- start:38 stop:979 length:942 start_codon:yes stop_codon:yes gene_type:complete
MITSCEKCQTTFKVDSNLVTNGKKFFKCSICDNEWLIDQNKVFDHQENTTNDLTSYVNDGKVEEGLEAIRSEIKKNTDKIEDGIRNVEKEDENLQSSKKQVVEKKNKVFNVKKKSVADIASEIAEASVKRSSLQVKKKKNKIKIKDDDFKNVQSIHDTHSYKVPLIMLMVIFAVSLTVYFRSAIVGISYENFPKYTEKYFPKIYKVFEKIKLPFNAELNKIEISNFGATYEQNAIKFFGNLKNNSSFPIVTPAIKALVVTEDGKILAETIIPISKKYISSKKELNFSHLFKTNKNIENTTVRATILKEIQVKG